MKIKVQTLYFHGQSHASVSRVKVKATNNNLAYDLVED